MIYHEIALEPEAIEDLKDLGLLERIFGFEHGRMIAVFPAKPTKTGSWGKLLERHLSNLLPEKRKEIEIRLKQLLPQLVCRSRNHSKLETEQEWYDLATKEHGDKSFSCLIGRGKREHPDWVPFQKLYVPDSTVPPCLTGPVHFGDAMKDPETFLGELQPLIFSATRVSFIDPYFNPVHSDPSKARKWRNTAKRLADYFREAKRLTADFQFHTKFKSELPTEFQRPDIFVQKVADTISCYFPATSKISVTAWEIRPNGIPFHARYIITDKAGVALDYGTDLGPKYRTDVALLPLAFARKRLKEFEKGEESPFKWKASVQTHGKQ